MQRYHGPRPPRENRIESIRVTQWLGENVLAVSVRSIFNRAGIDGKGSVGDLQSAAERDCPG